MKGYSDLTVIIPTLNEVDSVPKLIRIIEKEYKGAKVIVSDDGSDDGTKNAVRQIGRRNRNVRFLDRRNSRVHGLTASVVDAAMSARTGKIVVMDGDMQHPPDRIGRIYRMLDGNDIVIGVRESVKDWGMHRRIASKMASTFVYSAFLLRGKPTTADLMSGFFGIDAKMFKRLIKENGDQFVGKGYKVLLDILRIVGKDARIAEVRYSTFHDREHGKSKLGMRHIRHVVDSALR